MRKQLEFQANQIEMVLASHRVMARVWGGIRTPRFTCFKLTTPVGTRVSAVTRLAQEIAMTLGVASARVYRRDGTINVELPNPRPSTVPLLPLCNRLADDVPSMAAVLGVDDEGTPLLVRITSPDVAHVLICGTTGSGKTVLARSMILSLAMRNLPTALQIVLIDPMGRGFLPLSGLPHLMLPVVRGLDVAQLVLRRLTREMTRRDERGQITPRILLVIDELADLMLTGGAEVATALTRLTQRGRKAGIHVMACTQKPTTAVLGSLVKANFPLRLVGSVSSPDDARVAAGVGGTGAEKLLGHGDFLLVNKGQTVRFQAAWLDDDALSQAVGALGGSGTPAPLPALLTSGVDEPGPYAFAEKRRKEARTRMGQRALALWGEGWSKRRIQRELLGYTGGAAYEFVAGAVDGVKQGENPHSGTTTAPPTLVSPERGSRC